MTRVNLVDPASSSAAVRPALDKINGAFGVVPNMFKAVANSPAALSSMWGSFGGEIEYGETPDEGFVREIEEELAWTPRDFALYGAYAYPDRDGKQIIYIYSALVDVPFESLVLGEGQGMGYFALDALPARTVPDYAALLQRFANEKF